MVPDVRDFPGRGVAGQIDEDGGVAGRGKAAQKVEVGSFLERPLEPFGDLLQRLLDRRSGPDSFDHHGFDDEARIFVAAQAIIGENSSGHRDDHEIGDERAVVEGPLRQIQLLHSSDPSSRTFCPGCNAWTPAVTTTSPSSSPCETITVAGSKRNISTFRAETVKASGSTTQTEGCPFDFVSAEAGISIRGTASICTVPVTGAPRSMASGGWLRPTLT